MDTLRLLRSYLRASIRTQMQYPGSTAMMIVGQFFATFIEVLSFGALFARFGRVQGWRFGEIAVFYGLVSVSFCFADFLTRGFDVLGTQFIRTGDFDRVLLRPRSVTLQLVGFDMRLSRIGRLAQGLVVLAIGTSSLGLHWDLRTVALASGSVVGGAALFCGLMVLQGTLAFWTIESLEIANVLTYGGVQAAQYPLSLYAGWFRSFLIFVVPLGCVAYFPVLAVLGRHDPLGAPDWFLPVAPAMGFVFLGVALFAWRFGIARYTSTGS
ncbi:MAG: ABC transporter permease [Caulobacterales bacterium]